MIRPTGRAVVAFVCGIPLALIVAIYNPSLWVVSFAYGAIVLLAALTDVSLAFPPRLLDLKITVPDHISIGDRGAVTATIAPTRWRRATTFELIADQRGDVEPSTIVAGTLPPGEPLRMALPVIPRRRGQVHVDRVSVRWRGPLGFVELVREVTVDRAIDVLPNVRGVHGVALQFFSREAIYGIKTERHKGEGAEFEALREYVPGFDSRYIDWKHSARHRKLVCKEFQIERNHPVVMAFDTGYLMLEPIGGITRLDHAINAGLALAWISLQGGDLVGIYGFDAAVRHYLSPIRGISGFARIRRSTAELTYQHQETNFTLGLAELNARLKRRALVILFTDFVDTITAELLIESMQRVANRHVVVFVTQRGSVLQGAVEATPTQFTDVAQSVIAHDFLRERSIVFERLERLGVHCLDVPSRGLPVALINRYLLIKQRGLI
jgi:uncharacterized protein (DUF58 family)